MAAEALESILNGKGDYEEINDIMSGKRPRLSDIGRRVTFYIEDPTASTIPGADIMIDGKNAKAIPFTDCVSYNVAEAPSFWKLWLKFECKMLRKAGDREPFTDLMAPLGQMGDTKFVLCEWTPEYEKFRTQLLILKYTELIETINQELQRMEAQLTNTLMRKEACTTMLNALKSK